MMDFEQAKDKVIMGTERKSMIISEREKKITAYHEAGHTVVAKTLPGTDPVHKVTIIPRGMALGLTQQLPIEDRYNLSKTFAENQISILMGGRIAEELTFNHQTTGAGHDFETATEIAKKMVSEWGMSSLGPVTFGKREEQLFLGREITRHMDYSEATAVEIDREIKRIIMENYERAKKILIENKEKLVKMAEALLDLESLDENEIEMIMQGVEPESLKSFKASGTRAELAEKGDKPLEEGTTKEKLGSTRKPSFQET
jgi:cell division protease FtsH